MTPNFAESDKFFWHRYTDLYEPLFKNLNPRVIVEIGVMDGDSIRWLRKIFPDATIIGIDILSALPHWPKDSQTFYFEVDQSKRSDLSNVLEQFRGEIDLFIEDGSHLPSHQLITLQTALPFLSEGALYVLEDLHTSFREIDKLTSHRGINRLSISSVFRKVTQKIWRTARISGCHSGGPNVANILLAIERSKKMETPLSAEEVLSLCSESVTEDIVLSLEKNISAVKIWRRSVLPLWCYSCGSDQFDLRSLKCICGVELLLGQEFDSVTALIYSNLLRC